MIDVQEGQFCVIRKYVSYRVVRADKVTAKQIRTHRFGGMYDVEKRDDVLFAGTEEEASEIQDKASDVRWSVEAEIEEARLRFIAACQPFRETFDAESERARQKGQQVLSSLFQSERAGA